MSSFKFYLSIFILILIFNSCVSTPLPGSGIRIVPEDFFGLVHAGRTRTEEEFRILDEMGIVWVLKTFGWADIEPEKGVFDFSRYDPFVEAALENGHKIAVTLGYESPWIRSDVGKQKYIPNHYIDEFLNYIEITVNQYKGKVHAWQIWNEPNWIFWNGSDKEFFELSKLAALKIRETDPDAYIIGGAFLHAPSSYIKKMYKSGAMENLNALSFHPYGFNPRGSILMHENFNKILKQINWNGDIWITEAGYPTGGFYPSSVSLEEFPSYVIKTIAGFAARGTKVITWYQLFDRHLKGEAPNNHDSEMFYGLVYRDYTRKDASWAYQLCARNLPGSGFLPNLPKKNNVPYNIVSFCFMNGISGANTLILWNDNISKQKIKVTLSSAITQHSISSDDKITLEDNSIFEVTNTPIFITWEGESTPIISKVN